MKKLYLAVLIALVLDIAGTVVNYISFIKTQFLLLALRMHGGEITVEVGFGSWANHIYAMRAGDTNSHNFHFSIISFIVFLAALTLLIYIILTVIEKIRRH